MIHFYNLTNGLEIVDISKYPHITRIQSSHIEGKHWNHLFAQLSDELLFYLAIGKECVIVDASPKPIRSSLARIGIPVIVYILSRIWFHKKIEPQTFDKRYLESVYRSLTRSTKNKLKYYRKFLLTDRIRLKCFIGFTKNDGKYHIFKKKIQNQKDGD
ncbi:MAG: hypothetical protein ACP5IX_00415 [Patescibacteria group bacterium]